MTLSRHEQPALARPGDAEADLYKGRWSTLSNTTLGMLMATIDASIVLISLPDIFRGIRLNPLTPGNTSYFLWMLMGYMLVTAVLVVSFGRLGGPARRRRRAADTTTTRRRLRSAWPRRRLRRPPLVVVFHDHEDFWPST